MGYPVALEARAEDQETLGLTSMTAYSKLSGFRANWQLQPPSMPNSSMIFRAAGGHLVLFVHQGEGGGHHDGVSGVDAHGSKFSMEQMVMAVPLWSRITSNSISFHPKMYFSMSTWVMGE